MIQERPEGFLGPRNEPNCGVTAVAVIAGKPYAEIEALFRRLCGKGPRWGGKTFHADRETVLNALGVSHRTIFRYRFKGQSRSKLRTWVPLLPHGRTYLVTVTGHAFVLRDGLVIDQQLRDWTPVERARFAGKLVTSITQIGA